MKPSNTWALEYCQPANWTVDLTPPEGDWDYEVEPGSEDEKLLEGALMMHNLRAMGGVIGNFFTQVGSELGAGFKVISDAISPVVEQIAENMKPAVEIMEKLVAQADADHEEYLKEHGVHTIKSIKPELKLPIRTFNSGPQEKKTGRRQTG